MFKVFLTYGTAIWLWPTLGCPPPILLRKIPTATFCRLRRRLVVGVFFWIISAEAAATQLSAFTRLELVQAFR